MKLENTPLYYEDMPLFKKSTKPIGKGKKMSKQVTKSTPKRKNTPKHDYKKTVAEHKSEIAKLKQQIKKHKLLIKQAKLVYKISKK
jgi:hypothetical protein